MEKTNELMIEVTTYFKKEFDFEVVDSFSDCGGKSSLIRKNPDYNDGENSKNNRIKKYRGLCEFSVHKNDYRERYVIWDWRDDDQPFFDNRHCVWGEGFGRYEFTDKENFYDYIISNFWVNKQMELTPEL
jgi:hypothetical protein